ncbi:invasin domain 3-containing protein [Mycetocola spongiae]|uniref:invasin domain 3-containing protein n=1 Tax=Mycetocola spongiae TaxID=2859226 RepID=UPI001CF17344|nr:invasin domain 3-containing protein [Mycetocola spongiae]UCR89108.1 hypothetical protein KXZ72_14435 [Mycetocola spongiae]
MTQPASGSGKKFLTLLLASALALSGLTAIATLNAAAAAMPDNGYSHTFYVDDARDVADATPGDGVCATRFSAGTPAVPTCTLYAAIQEANALPADASVLIAPAPQIRLVNGTYAASAEIQLNWNTTNNPAPQVPEMSRSMVNDAGINAAIDGDTNSRYWVQHDNVTLDFQNRLGWSIVTDSGYNVLLFTGKNQTFRNFTKLTSAEGGIYVGATAENFSVINGQVANPATTPALPSNYALERGIVIVEGAKNTLIQNVHFQRNYWDAILLAPARNGDLIIDGLTVDRSSWDQPVNGGGYDPVYNYFVRNWNTAVSGQNILITNNTVRAWGADGGNSNVIDFTGGTWNNMMIRGNTFTATVNRSNNPIYLNNLGPTTTTVRDNTFIYDGPGTQSSSVNSSWVRVNGSTTANSSDGVRIFNNSVVGGYSAVQISNQSVTAKTNPIYRNIMTRVGGIVTAANENTLTNSNGIYNAANGRIRTVFPTAATVISEPAQACRIDIAVAPPGTGGNAIPTQDIYVDVFLGRGAFAGGDGEGLEQYVGRISTTQAALPATFGLPYTGTGDQNVVRLQTTEVATGNTSQYSRVVSATGLSSCAPQAWIKQGGWFNEAGTLSSTQEDPTSFRDVSFEIRASEPVGSNALTAEDIVFTGTAPGQQVVSLTPISLNSWTLVTRANGTGTIVPMIPAGAFSNAAGVSNVDPANTTAAPINFAGFSDIAETTGIAGPDIDHSVLYNSPLGITGPDPLAITVAEPGTETASFRVSNLSVDPAGRVTKAPTAPVILGQQWSGLVPDATLPIPVPEQTAAGILRALPTHENLSATEPTLDTIDRFVDVPVQAIDNLVVDGTRAATLNLTVTSEDPEFNGLILRPVPVTVTDNDRPIATAATLSVETNGQLANGLENNVLRAHVENADGAAVSNAAVTFGIPENTTWPGPDGIPGTEDDVIGGPEATATILTVEGGEARLHLVSEIPGSYSVTARVNGTETISGSPQSVTFKRAPIDIANPGTNFTVSGGSVIADGVATHTVTVNLTDGAGHPAAGWVDALSGSVVPAAGTVLSGFSATETLGEYTATLTSTVAQTVAVAVSLRDDAGTENSLGLLEGGNRNAVFIAGIPEIGEGRSGVIIDDNNARPADGTAAHQITVTLADALGNPVTGVASRLSTRVADNASGAVIVSALAETGTPGVYRALVRSTSAGAHEITVLFDGALEIGSVSALFAAGAPDLGNPGTRVRVSTGEQTVGSGSHSITVTLADAFGNPVSGQAASLVATTPGALGGGSITGFTETATAGTYTATITSQRAGDKVLTTRLGVAAITVDGNATARFIAAAADLENTGSRMVVSGGEVTAGEGTHGVTVTLADRYGNPVSGRAADLAAISAEDLGTGEISAFTEGERPGTYLATVSSSISGDKTIEATLAGAEITAGGNTVAAFIASSVDVDNIGTRFTVTGGDQTVSDGTHTITVTLSDSLGNPVPDQAAGILSTTSADLGGGAISAFSETDTIGTYTASVTSTLAGDKPIRTVFGADRLTVLAEGNDTARFIPAAVDPGASGFEVSSGTQTVGTGTHSVDITLRDGFGNPVSDRAADLAATATPSTGVTLSAITEISPGLYRATVGSTVAGTTTIAVSLDTTDLAATGNAEARFRAGAVDLENGSFYTVSGGSVSVSGVPHSVSITLRDAFDNPVTGQAGAVLAATVDPLGSGGIGAFVESEPGLYLATVTSSVAGIKAITATFGGLSISGKDNTDADFIAGGVDPGNDATRYRVSTGTATVGSGEHTVSVTLADSTGNPVRGQAQGLSAISAQALGGGEISAFTESAQTPGTYQARITSTLAGSKTITVRFGAAPVTLNGNGIARFIAADVDLTGVGSGYRVSTGTASVAGGSHTVTVTLADEFGNPVAVPAANLAAATAAGLGTGVISGFTASATAGTFTATVTSSLAGIKPITVTLGADPVTSRGNADASFIAGGVAPGSSRFTVSTDTVPAGTGSHMITTTLADAAGNPVSGQAAGLLATAAGGLGTGSITSFIEDGAPGSYRASVTSSSAGSKTISVTFGGSALAADGNRLAVFSAGNVDPGALGTGYSVSGGSASVEGGSHTVTATLSDALGNPVSGESARLAADTEDALGGGGISGFTETTTAGRYSALITSSISGGKAVTVTYDAGDLELRGNGIATFIAGEPDTSAEGTHYRVSTGDRVVGEGEHTVTVSLVDAAGNAVTGMDSTLEALSTPGLGSGEIGEFSESETEPGTYTATIGSTLAGEKTITVTTHDDPISADGNTIASFIAAAVDPADALSTYRVSAGQEIVGTGEHTVTVTLGDAYGNPVSGAAAGLLAISAQDIGDGIISSFTESAEDPGTYTASIGSSLAGDKTITVGYDGVDLATTANTVAEFIAGSVDPGNAATGFAVSTDGVVVGSGTHTITVTLADAAGNPVSGAAGTLLATTTAGLGSGSITAFTPVAATPGSYTASVSSTSAGSKPIQVTSGSRPLTADGNAAALFLAAAVDPGQDGTRYSVSTGNAVVGTGSHLITVTLADGFGNPAPGHAARLSAEAEDLGAGVISGFSPGTTAGTYTATIGSTLAGSKAVSVNLDTTALTVSGNGSAVFIAAGVDPDGEDTGYHVSTGEAVAGAGSHTITVTLADALGNPVPGIAASLVALSEADLGTGSISGFSETTTAGTYTATVTSTRSGEKPITVTSDGQGLEASGNTLARFIAGDPAPGNAGTGFSVSTGSASIAGGTHLITVTVADALGNPVPGLAADIAATTSADLGDGEIANITESAVPGTYIAEVTSSLAGSKPISATLDGTALTARGNTAAVFIAGGVNPGNAATSYAVSTGNAVVGTGSHTITALLADSGGNPVAGQSAGLTAQTLDALGTGVISGFTETTTAGTYTATISSAVAGTKTVTVRFGATELNAEGNTGAVFVAGAVSPENPGTGFIVSTGERVVGLETHTVTIVLRDALGNAVSGAAADLAVNTTASLGEGEIGAITEGGSAGVYTASIGSTVSGSKPITATWDGAALSATGNTNAVFAAGEVVPNGEGSAFSVSTGDASVTDGSHLITVRLVDGYGNPVPGQATRIAAASEQPLGDGEISGFSETPTAGTYTASITSSISGPKTVAATFESTELTASGNNIAIFTAGGVDLGNENTRFYVGEGTRVVGVGTHEITAILADAAGNAVPGQADCLSAVSAQDLGAGSVSGFTETAVAGTYTAQVGSTSAGEKTITVRCGASAVEVAGNDIATFIAAAVDPGAEGTGYLVTTGDRVVGSGGHTVTATLSDEFGNPVSGFAVALAAASSADLGGGVISGFVAGSVPGTYTATVTSTRSGAKPITVSLDDVALSGGANTEAVFIAADVDLTAAGTGFEVSAGEASVAAGSHAVTITLRDEFGNAVPGQAPSLLAATAAALGTGGITAPVETTTAGTYSATITSSLAGEKPVTVTLAGEALTALGNATATFIAGGVDPTHGSSGFMVGTGSVPVGGAGHPITVTLADAAGNPVAGQAAGLRGTSVATLGDGEISAFTETDIAGTYSAQVTSTSAGSKPIGVTFGASVLRAAGNADALFGAEAVDLGAAGSGLSVPGGPATVGTGSHPITITLSDRYGNPVGGITTLSARTEAALGDGAIGAVTETATAGTYRAIITSTLAGLKPVTGQFGDLEIPVRGNANAAFVSGPADPAHTLIEATGPIRADGIEASTVTVQLRDGFNNPATAVVPVALSTTLGTPGEMVHIAEGEYRGQVRSLTPGTAVVTPVVQGVRAAVTAEIIFLDATPPAPPVPEPTAGSSVSGCSEPGSTVTVYDAAGRVIGVTTAGEDCRFTAQLSPRQEPGAVIFLTATDADGDVSERASVRVGLITLDLESDPLTAGDVQRAFGHHFQPGEEVSGLLQSDPIALGTRMADAEGNVIFEVRIPSDFEPGIHRVTLTGSFSGAVSATFEVRAPAPIITGPGLSLTGASAILPLGLGALLLLVGGWLLILRRKKRENDVTLDH